RKKFRTSGFRRQNLLAERLKLLSRLFRASSTAPGVLFIQVVHSFAASVAVRERLTFTPRVDSFPFCMKPSKCSSLFSLDPIRGNRAMTSNKRERFRMLLPA